MSKFVGVRLSKTHQEKLLFLYNLYQIENEIDTDRFRELLDAIYSEKVNPSDIATLSTTEPSELGLLDDWNCAYRAIIYCFNKNTKKMEPKIDCGHPSTRQIRGTTLMDIPVCKSCYDRGGSTKLLSLPAPKKPEKPQPASKPLSVRKQKNCIDCGRDISVLTEEWKTRCASCYRKKQNPAWQGDAKPLVGSPLDLRMKQAEAIRRAHEEINEKNGTKTEE